MRVHPIQVYQQNFHGSFLFLWISSAFTIYFSCFCVNLLRFYRFHLPAEYLRQMAVHQDIAAGHNHGKENHDQ